MTGRESRRPQVQEVGAEATSAGPLPAAAVWREGRAPPSPLVRGGRGPRARDLSVCRSVVPEDQEYGIFVSEMLVRAPCLGRSVAVG